MNPSVDNERGSITPLVVFFTAAVMGAMSVTVLVANDLGDASRAQSAADAAALAGAAKGPIAARSAAVANRAKVVRIKDNAQLGRAIDAATGATQGTIGDVTVTVKVGRHTKSARAQTKTGKSNLVAG